MIYSGKRRLDLETLQALVGGSIELVRRGDEMICCNEDGIFKELPPNKIFPEFVGNIVIGKEDAFI